MPSLPIPGASKNVWGTKLNEFLRVSHEEDGSLKDAASEDDLTSLTAVVDQVEAQVTDNTTGVGRVDPGASAITDIPDGALMYEDGDPVVRRLGFWDITRSGAISAPLPADLTDVSALATLYSSLPDSSAAITAAVAKAKTLGVPLVGAGTYRVDASVQITCDADFTGALFLCNSTSIGTLIRIGSTAGLTYGVKVVAPQVIQLAHTVGSGWGTSDIGIELCNLVYSRIETTLEKGFWRGIWLTSTGSRGSVHNHIDKGRSQNCKEQFVILPQGTTAWTNDNKIYDGDFAHNSGEGTNVSGVRHIVIGMVSGGLDTNGNRFYGPSLENPACEFHANITGTNNAIFHARGEMSGGFIKVRFDGTDGTTQKNELYFGANSESWVISEVNGAQGNFYDNPGYTWKQYHKDTGGLVLSHVSSSGNIFTVMSNDALITDDPLTAYLVRMRATSTHYKRLADTFNRLEIEHNNGAFAFGSGSATPDVRMARAAANVLALDAGDSFRLTTGYVEFGEIADPSAPSANLGRLYIKDNGAGKSQLAVRFPSGAVQIIATEP